MKTFKQLLHEGNDEVNEIFGFGKKHITDEPVIDLQDFSSRLGQAMEEMNWYIAEYQGLDQKDFSELNLNPKTNANVAVFISKEYKGPQEMKVDKFPEYVRPLEIGETKSSWILTYKVKYRKRLEKQSPTEVFLQAIGNYTGDKPESAKVYEDPKVSGTYAIRDSNGHDWLAVMGDESLSAEIIEQKLEEVEFETWPPKSGELSFS